MKGPRGKEGTLDEGLRDRERLVAFIASRLTPTGSSSYKNARQAHCQPNMHHIYYHYQGYHSETIPGFVGMCVSMVSKFQRHILLPSPH
ncbi:unnamed protein product [Allacma fusca]|uniref:Uncharacterized protein n=1 Tax=Allacma fusca TaxID=39272 RepID=A0A8J2J1S4_9HEXA|nr:unnamed protein product [Allacma fusca]